MRHRFHAPEQPRRSEWNRHAAHFAHRDVLRRFLVINAAGRAHQVHENLIGHADDIVLLKFAGLEFAHGVVG
jgi:hypothetical protein